MMAFYRACELLGATGNPDNKRIKRLIDSGRLHNAADALKNTLLHHAATAGNQKIVKYLVNSGSSVNVRNNFGSTPLMSNLKAEFPCKKVAKILLEARSIIEFKDQSGKSALDIVDCSTWLGDDIEKYEIYKMFLESATDFKYFKLLWTGDERIIGMLMQANVDVLLKDSSGVSLVHVFARNKNPGVMALIHSKSNFDINLCCEYNRWTPLIYATLYGSTRAMEFLLDKGADIEAVDDSGLTILYLAYAMFNYNKVKKDGVQILLERGANAQIEATSRFGSHTIVDLALEHTTFTLGELLLAHLALEEMKGHTIKQLIKRKIESNSQYKNYFEQCKQLLLMKIYRSITLYDVLAASEMKLERYLRDKEVSSKLLAFQSVEYFDKLKSKRLLRGRHMIELKKIAASVISELLVEIDYVRYPALLDEIVRYLGEKDIKCLVSMDSEVFE